MNYSDTNVKNNQSFFAKVEILRILTSHFLPDLLPKVGQSPEKVSFSTHTETHFLRFWEKKVKNPARGASFAKVKVKIKKRTHTVYLWYPGGKQPVNMRSSRINLRIQSKAPPKRRPTKNCQNHCLQFFLKYTKMYSYFNA